MFSETEEEHQKHVHKVLAVLEKAGLSINPKKNEFHVTQVDFLGYRISPGQIRMDPTKIKDVAECPAPTTVSGVRGFLGFVNFYRRFIKGFGGIAKPPNDLTKKDTDFIWSKECDNAFQTLKQMILDDPILVLPDPDKEFEVETDASDWAIGGQLGQRDEQGRLHPVTFYSKAFRGPELNYPIHGKELMSIIWAFKEWKPWLSGTKYEVKVSSDHKNLTFKLSIRTSLSYCSGLCFSDCVFSPGVSVRGEDVSDVLILPKYIFPMFARWDSIICCNSN
ncbi:hypothetical protein SMACR_10067 [Sordaria macrospora]|uniref:Reverse transcriptase/retrotransposon-derived protein RNase H-like domain-containing protein n=1 Tax=Sordaria macrospora TaxID=5147 RepID=A0A8S8ZCC1_SORMA|nr:hypothetical protein SMACR_10067 [Sordaria macrospora]WPJ58597.1 hypothetical protein SMAC4_10067 [Sordaria macrospora]